MDSGLKDFQTRLGRIDKVHKSGGAFEASGSLGQSYFTAARPKRFRRIPWRGGALLLCGVLLFKTSLLAHVGAAAYDEQIEKLAADNPVSRAAAWVLRAGPTTHTLAGYVSSVIR